MSSCWPLNNCSLPRLDVTHLSLSLPRRYLCRVVTSPHNDCINKEINQSARTTTATMWRCQARLAVTQPCQLTVHRAKHHHQEPDVDDTQLVPRHAQPHQLTGAHTNQALRGPSCGISTRTGPSVTGNLCEYNSVTRAKSWRVHNNVSWWHCRSLMVLLRVVVADAAANLGNAAFHRVSVKHCWRQLRHGEKHEPQ